MQLVQPDLLGLQVPRVRPAPLVSPGLQDLRVRPDLQDLQAQLVPLGLQDLRAQLVPLVPPGLQDLPVRAEASPPLQPSPTRPARRMS